MRSADAVRGVAIVLASVLALGSLTVAQEPPSAAAARDARAHAARSRLAELIGGDAGIEGRFFERIPGSYVFSPRRGDLPQARVVNPGDVSPMAVGPLLDVWGTLDGKGALTVARYRLARRPHLESDPSDPALPVDVKAASAGLRAALEIALKPGAMSVVSRSLDDPSDLTKSARARLATIRKAYRQALQSGADDEAIRAIVRQWAALRTVVADVFPDSDDHKALYGPPDNYDAWRYDLIYRQSRAVVAIGEPDATTARCSGALIGPDLVLTAAHCFAGSHPMPPKALEVWFDYARLETGGSQQMQRRPIVELVAPSPARLPDILAGEFDSQLLDYAIVRFGPALGQPLTPLGVAPQCLRTSTPGRNDPVYVVGYPRGDPVMVHDSARVYLPHRILDGELFFQLRLDVDADLLDAPGRAEFMREFDVSYETIRESNDVTYRYLYHVKDGNQPRMGIIADTFKGNSGGPVFDRERRQCVVGVLIAGATDTGVRLTASWKHHERVLPVSAVLEDAERHAPGIRGKLTLEKP